MKLIGNREAARVLRQGGVVANPAEACFGLACDPMCRESVYRILALKRRDSAQGLILVAANLYQLTPYLGADAASLLADPIASWPGPNTWILPASARTPAWITGASNRVAVRVTAMPALAGLCRRFGGAIVSTSANPHGLPPATDIGRLRFYFGRRLEYAVRGRTGGLAKPSQIRDAATGATLRAG